MNPVETRDGSCTLYSDRYGQTFHSHHGAVRESLHVFLDATGVAERLASGLATRVLEVGFGTGLNSLLTADAALAGTAELHFLSLEHQLLAGSTLRELNHAQHLAQPTLAEALYAAVDGADHASDSLSCELTAGICIEVLMGDALEAQLPHHDCDAVYLDAFSPEANPELWTESFLGRLRGALKPGGRLATYSAKGSVRRALLAAGFDVEKRPGPPGKREMLLATRPD